MKINIGKIKIFLKKLPRMLGEHAFIFFLTIILLELILGGLLFYKYNILAEKVRPKVVEKPLQFEEKVYKQVLNEWAERHKRLGATETKKYFDFFSKP